MVAYKYIGKQLSYIKIYLYVCQENLSKLNQIKIQLTSSCAAPWLESDSILVMSVCFACDFALKWSMDNFHDALA